MNPRQRRGVLLMILAALGAVAVFVSVLSYVGQVNDKVGNMRQVLQLTQEVPVNGEITAAVVHEVEVPAKWASNTALESLGQIQGKVAATDLPAGARLQKGMVQTAPALEPGSREIAIMVDAETSVAGKIAPGSIVDIYATFPATEQHPACAVRVQHAVEIIQVGQTTQQQNTTETGQTSVQSQVPVTFALPGNSSLNLTYVDANADSVRLARIGGDPTAKPPKDDTVCNIPALANDGGGAAAQAGGGGRR